jgi:O-antigen/teichoic acid export membrane protein
MSTLKNVLSGTIWGMISKIVAACTNFITIPLLVSFYGKADFGLITLAFSLNAYLRIMDMGMNIGSIRFFSIWIKQKEWNKVEQASQSSICFYALVGLVNAFIFLLMAAYPNYFFKLSPDQVSLFRTILYVLSASTLLNWVSNVINHLLSAYGEISWMNKITSISSVCSFIGAIIAVEFKVSLDTYFLFYTLSVLIVIPFNLYKLKNRCSIPLKKILLPHWYWSSYHEIIKYSLAIFAMGIFQFSADNFRPILLESYAGQGISSLTDYRVIQTVSSLVMMFGGVFLQVLLPSVSKFDFENDRTKIEDLVYNGTRYISVLIVFFVFIISASSEEILSLYMGKDYTTLSLWLTVWLISLLGMHNSPVASIVLSIGNTKPLVYMSAISCIISLPITAVLAPRFNVGAAVIGYLIYVVMQSLFYYLYYTPKVLKLNSVKLFFTSFLPSALIGVVVYMVVKYSTVNYHIELPFVMLVIKSTLFCLLYALLILAFVIRPKQLQFLIKKLISK